MPLSHKHQNTNYSNELYKDIYETMTKGEIHRVMYSLKNICHEHSYDRYKVYNSLDISCMIQNEGYWDEDDQSWNDGTEFIYFELCPMEGNDEENYAGRTFTSYSKVVKEPREVKAHYYNKILMLVEDFLNMPIEEFTSNTFLMVNES